MYLYPLKYRFESELIYWTKYKKTENLVRISIEYPVVLPGEHDGVHPQAHHGQDYQHLVIGLDVKQTKFQCVMFCIFSLVALTQ